MPGRWRSALAASLVVLSQLAPAASPVVESINGQLTPPFLVFDNAQAGWIFTPSRSLVLDGVSTTFANVGAASQLGTILPRTVTVSFFDGSPKGALLGRTTFTADASAGVLGGSVAPVLLPAGRPVFIGFDGLRNLGLNIVDWQITSPQPVQPAGTVNLDGWYFGEQWATYVPQRVNGVLQVFSAPILRLQGSETTVLPAADCLFRWAERTYPQLFAPAGAASQAFQTYWYRHYPGTQAYVGVSATDQHVYYIGPDGRLQDVGPLAGWLTLAGCPAS